MAYVIPRAEGVCCACGEFSGCSCSGIACALECESKSGVAALCGYSEFASPSVPPKKYRVIGFAGSLHGIAYSSAGCGSGPLGYFDVHWSGANVYSGVTCAETIGAEQAISENGGAATVSPLTGFNLVANCFGAVTKTATLATGTGTDDCCATGSGTFQRHTGERTAALSIEDTEDDALTRAEDAASWTPAGAPGCLGVTAFREQRGAGEFDFAFSSVRTRANLVDLEVGGIYAVTIRYFRRVYGTSDAYEFFADEVLQVVADATSESTDWVDVPNNAGYQTRAENCSVVRLS